MLKAARKAALVGAEGKAVPDTEMAKQLPNAVRLQDRNQTK